MFLTEETSKFSLSSFYSWSSRLPILSKLYIEYGLSWRNFVCFGLKCKITDLMWKFSHNDEYASEYYPFCIKNHAFFTIPPLQGNNICLVRTLACHSPPVLLVEPAIFELEIITHFLHYFIEAARFLKKLLRRVNSRLHENILVVTTHAETNRRLERAVLCLFELHHNLLSIFLKSSAVPHVCRYLFSFELLCNLISW